MSLQGALAELRSPKHFQQNHGRRVIDTFVSALESAEQGRSLRERAYTDLLCAADGAFERALVVHLLRLADAEPDLIERAEVGTGSSREIRLVGAHDIPARLRLRDGRPTRIVPDLFVAERGMRLADGEFEWLPIVGIEAKFGAMVNSAFNYCPAGEHVLEDSGERYSSQVICYVNGCWLSDSAEEQVRPIGYVWLGRKPRVVGPAFVAREEISVFAEAQREALGRWKSMDHWDIVGERGLMSCAGLPDLAAALRPHLARWSSAA